MADWQEAKIATNGIHLHYVRTGGDKPPLLLAHGFSDDGLCWTPVAQKLATDYDVIMVDARGHGRSDAPEQGYSPVDMAADLAGVITGLGLQKPAVLGHSMGGATTLVLGGMYPDLPGAILIEDAGERNLFGGSRDEIQERQKETRARMNKLQSMTREELVDWGRKETPTWSEEELQPWADAKQRFNLNAIQRQGTKVTNWKEILANITCPALLITADPDLGAIVTPEQAVEMQELIPQLRVVHIPQAGHNIRRERFDPYMDAVTTFLTQQAKGS